MTHQASGQWDKEYPGHQGTRDQLLRKMLTMFQAQTHTAQGSSLPGAVRCCTNLCLWGKAGPGPTQTHLFYPALPVCPASQQGNKNRTANMHGVLTVCHHASHLTDIYWLILLTNPVSRYCYYSHFTNGHAGTERLHNNHRHTAGKWYNWNSEPDRESHLFKIHIC